MFWHNFKYSLKTLLRNRGLLFWTFIFPILLGLFFYMAFSDIEKKEKLDIINIAVIDNEEFKKDEISGKITVNVNGIETTNYILGNGTLSSDGTTKTFPLTINNYTGGSISIIIDAGALVDTSGNTSDAKTYTFTPDTTSPVWEDNILNGQFSLSGKTYKFDVKGSDETSLNTSASTLTKSSNISITVDGTSTTNYTIGTATTSGNTKTFPITINNFTGGTVKVTISAGALKDTAGNTSAQKEYLNFRILMPSLKCV